MGKSCEPPPVCRKIKSRGGLLPKKPKALAFDFDGTIVDSVDYMASTWLQLAQSMGIEPHVNVRELVGMTGNQIARILAGGNEALVAEMVAKRREHFDVDRYVTNVKLFPESVAVLAELRRRGYRMALASSTTAERIQRMASSFGVETYFDATVGGDEVARSKPAPDLVIEAAMRLRTDVSEMAYVGDTRHDVEATSRAGAMSILVLRKGAEYSGPAPDVIVHDLFGLIGTLLKHCPDIPNS